MYRGGQSVTVERKFFQDWGKKGGYFVEILT